MSQTTTNKANHRGIPSRHEFNFNTPLNPSLSFIVPDFKLEDQNPSIPTSVNLPDISTAPSKSPEPSSSQSAGAIGNDDTGNGGKRVFTFSASVGMFNLLLVVADYFASYQRPRAKSVGSEPSFPTGSVTKHSTPRRDIRKQHVFVPYRGGRIRIKLPPPGTSIARCVSLNSEKTTSAKPEEKSPATDKDMEEEDKDEDEDINDAAVEELSERFKTLGLSSPVTATTPVPTHPSQNSTITPVNEPEPELELELETTTKKGGISSPDSPPALTPAASPSRSVEQPSTPPFASIIRFDSFQLEPLKVVDKQSGRIGVISLSDDPFGEDDEFVTASEASSVCGVAV